MTSEVGPASAEPIVVGLDLSLASTGYALARRDILITLTIPGLGRGLDRLRHLTKLVCTGCRTADLVVMEAPAFHMGTSAGYHERAGLHWMMLERLDRDGQTVVQVPASVVKKYATGKGNASKTAMVEAATRRYPDVQTGGDDNQCDALWLAAIGIDHLTGRHVVPESHRAVLGSVRWPSHD